MRHKLVIDIQNGEPLPLVDPFEVGSLGAEVFSHITLVCRRIQPFPLAGEPLHSLQRALYSGPLWGPEPPAVGPLPVNPGLVSHVRMLSEQPDGRWVNAHDFELGR